MGNKKAERYATDDEKSLWCNALSCFDAMPVKIFEFLENLIK